ncbi:MAG: radical SAM protein [Myxococcota bacterium]
MGQAARLHADLTVGGGCNNGCKGCLWTRRLTSAPRASVPVPESVAGRFVRLAGREPTVRADLVQLVQALRAGGATGVEIETNGRMLAYSKYVRAIHRAGLDRAAIKLFGVDATSWEAHTRVPGSFAQTLEAIATVRREAPQITLVAVLVARREPGARLDELLTFALSLGFAHVRVDLRLAKLDLAALPALLSLARELRRAPPKGVSLDFSAG